MDIQQLCRIKKAEEYTMAIVSKKEKYTYMRKLP